ncbi:MAG: DUF4157 domain-containing protein [Nostoc sp.]
MREHFSREKKTTGFSIPSLKHPIRSFGLESSAISRQAVPEIQPLHKPVTHDISRIPLRCQTKLSISQPGDIYEQEADSVAQQVMQRMAQPGNRQSIQPEALPEEEELQMKPLDASTLQRQEIPEDEEELQMKPLDISTLQRQEIPEDEEELQMKPLDISTLQRQELPEDEEELQMKPLVQRQAEAGMAAAPELETSISQAKGSGQPMADNIRAPMEQAFGADFSGVKVHTDSESNQLNRSIQARAFTTGQDVFFGQGEYNPESRSGQELLAHELTHVVQQNGQTVQRSPLPSQQLPQHLPNETPSAAYHDMSNSAPVVQRAERQTTLYGQHGQQWQKNMQIIDSISASDYVHLSRSTTTDPESIHTNQLPNDIVFGGVQGRRQRVETATDDNQNFDRAQYTAVNNVHITLEGRYMQVMRTLATNMFDNREAIKNGPPVGNFANLNFGDFETHEQQQVSKYGIQQWITIAADDTEDFLRTNVTQGYQETVPELIEVVNEVENSTLNFTNQLISSTPELNQLEQNNNLVHYAGAPWART